MMSLAREADDDDDDDEGDDDCICNMREFSGAVTGPCLPIAEEEDVTLVMLVVNVVLSTHGASPDDTVRTRLWCDDRRD